MEFYIDVENSAGQVQGDGPITSASGWTYTARLSRGGNFSFAMPATDPKAALVQRKRVVRAYALLGGAWIEVGAGIVDRIERTPGADGITWLTVSGPDLLGELINRTVKDLRIYFDNAPISHAAAVNAIAAFAPAGWTFTPDSAPPNNSLYLRFNGHTVLNALVKIGEACQDHFYRGAGRNVTFASSFSPSGVRAIRADGGDLAPETAAISEISEQIDTYDLITRIYPRGSGNGDVQLTLKATTRTAPSGFVLDKANNYIESTAATTAYGLIERQVDFRDIGPIENTTPDVRAAANMLFDAALEELKRRSTELEQATYTIALDQCSALLRPLQSIWVDYADPDSGLTVRQTLNILEATWSVDESGVQTTGLVVSNADRWPASDNESVVSLFEQGQVYQALPQLNANSYTTGYKSTLDSTEIGAAAFWFGREVVQLQQVLFRFRLLPLESTVKAVGGISGAAGALPTSGPSIDSTNTAGVTTTSTGGPTATETGGPTETGGASGETGPGGSGDTSNATPTIGNTTPTIGDTTPTIGNATPTIGNTTPDIGNATPAIGQTGLTTEGNTTGTATGDGGSGNTSDTSLATNAPQGGDTEGSGQHGHGIVVFSGSGNQGSVDLHHLGSGNYEFRNSGIGGAVQPNAATLSGNHTHAITAHTHTIGAHGHTIAPHSHTIGVHTHTIAPHSHTSVPHNHTISPHSHTIAPHSHTIAPHSHTIAPHSHTIAPHSHTIGPHTHTVAPHTHTIAQHTHGMNQHTHSLSAHAHDLSEAISAVYGIFRESGSRTYGLSDLQYQINGGGWLALNTATDVGGGRWALDLTNQVMDPDTFRPVQEANLLELRATPTGDPITTIIASGSFVLVTLASGFDAGNVGQVMQIANTVAHDGFYVISGTSGGDSYVAAGPFGPTTSESAGTVRILKTVTIDGLLSIRNIIQATSIV